MNIRLTTTLAVLVLTATTPALAQFPDDGFSDYRNRVVRPVSRTVADDFPTLPEDLFGRSDVRLSNRLPADPFRRSGGESSREIQRRGDELRYRVPVDSGFERSDRAYDRTPADRNDTRLPSRPEYLDPFVPAPLPERQRDEESISISEMLTARYQNPATVRAIRAMSNSQAVALFAEVSQKIDERSLQPTSYDVRVRRGLRNLSLALDNQAFINSLGISGSSFHVDGFRNTLSRLASGSQVRTYQEARSVLDTVMNQATSVPGLTASVVGFEFANASLDTLDKFSGLVPADPATPRGADAGEMQSASLDDQIVGIGVEVREHPEGLVVVRSLRGGPAADSGIQTGDVILSINGRSLAGMKMATSVDLMKGSGGSQIRLRIFRENMGERDFTLTRRTIRVWTVNDVRILPGTNVGYFSLSRFSQSSKAEVEQALNSLHTQGMKSLVMDLRGNPGGLLTSCVEITDMFLPCGTIVTTRGRQTSDNMAESATFAKTWSVPLVVLVDSDSASASEIFAAAIQENGRGVVVGTRSYGKGSVQTHFPLSAISGDLRLTTALFYSPNGRPMSGQGVNPDVEIHDRDGLVNGDEVLIEATRIARSTKLQDMARASANCRTGNPVIPRSSSLSNIKDPVYSGSEIR